MPVQPLDPDLSLRLDPDSTSSPSPPRRSSLSHPFPFPFPFLFSLQFDFYLSIHQPLLPLTSAFFNLCISSCLVPRHHSAYFHSRCSLVTSEWRRSFIFLLLPFSLPCSVISLVLASFSLQSRFDCPSSCPRCSNLRISSPSRRSPRSRFSGWIPFGHEHSRRHSDRLYEFQTQPSAQCCGLHGHFRDYRAHRTQRTDEFQKVCDLFESALIARKPALSGDGGDGGVGVCRGVVEALSAHLDFCSRQSGRKGRAESKQIQSGFNCQLINANRF